MSVRFHLAPTLDTFGILDLAAIFSRSFYTRNLTVLMYHRICVPGADPLLNPRVISTTPEEFEQQMRWLRRNTAPIGFNELALLQTEGKPLPRRAVLVTLDDGYLDNYLHAYPVLKAFDIPATIFLVTGLVGQNEAFWWEQVTATLLAKHVGLPEIHQELERLKQLSDEERRSSIANILVDASVESSELPRTIVNWDEVTEMADHGVEFGGHTVTHPILSRLSPEALKYEVNNCKKTIEEHTAKKVLSFAYPVGRKFAVSEDAIRAVREAGYRYAVTTEYGDNQMNSLDPFQIKRIGITLDDEIPRFKAKMLAPRYFGPRTDFIP